MRVSGISLGMVSAMIWLQPSLADPRAFGSVSPERGYHYKGFVSDLYFVPRASLGLYPEGKEEIRKGLGTIERILREMRIDSKDFFDREIWSGTDKYMFVPTFRDDERCLFSSESDDVACTIDDVTYVAYPQFKNLNRSEVPLLVLGERIKAFRPGVSISDVESFVGLIRLLTSLDTKERGDLSDEEQLELKNLWILARAVGFSVASRFQENFSIHPNGGGVVMPNSEVDEDVYLHYNVLVDNSRVTGNIEIWGSDVFDSSIQGSVSFDKVSVIRNVDFQGVEVLLGSDVRMENSSFQRLPATRFPGSRSSGQNSQVRIGDRVEILDSEFEFYGDGSVIESETRLSQISVSGLNFYISTGTEGVKAVFYAHSSSVEIGENGIFTGSVFWGDKIKIEESVKSESAWILSEFRRSGAGSRSNQELVSQSYEQYRSYFDCKDVVCTVPRLGELRLGLPVQSIWIGANSEVKDTLISGFSEIALGSASVVRKISLLADSTQYYVRRDGELYGLSKEVDLEFESGASVDGRGSTIRASFKEKDRSMRSNLLLFPAQELRLDAREEYRFNFGRTGKTIKVLGGGKLKRASKRF